MCHGSCLVRRHKICLSPNHFAATEHITASGSGFITFLGSYNIFIAPICGVSAISVITERHSLTVDVLDYHNRLLSGQEREHPHTVAIRSNAGQSLLWHKRVEHQGSVRLGVRCSPWSPRLNRSLPSVLGLRGREASLPDWMGCMLFCCHVHLLRALPCAPSAGSANKLNECYADDVRTSGRD